MELKRIFKHRNFWVGVAMVWIVFFHSAVMVSWVPLNVFKDLGYAGVDICLFASGIGCYYSLEKDPDILRFLKRRATRLAPVYYCFIIPWLIYKVRSPPVPRLGDSRQSSGYPVLLFLGLPFQLVHNQLDRILHCHPLPEETDRPYANPLAGWSCYDPALPFDDPVLERRKRHRNGLQNSGFVRRYHLRQNGKTGIQAERKVLCISECTCRFRLSRLVVLPSVLAQGTLVQRNGLVSPYPHSSRVLRCPFPVGRTVRALPIHKMAAQGVLHCWYLFF